MKTIGIIGGMGPLATVDLFHRIVTLTKAESDQEHIPILIDNNTRVPDRTAAILHGGKSPVEELIRSAARLENMGADFLIMPCNTSHWFYNEIVRHTNLTLVNMIEETVKYIDNLGIGRVGLLATDGTFRVGIYDQMFQRFGINFIKPDPEEQKHVMDVIYNGIKAKNNAIDLSLFHETLRRMESRGVEAFVLGCTELPIAFDQFLIPNQSINPTEILAMRAIVLAGGQIIS